MVRDGEGEGARRAERGEEEEEDGGADPSLRQLPSRVLLANQRQHSEGSLALSPVPPFLPEPHNKTTSVSSPVDIMRIFPPRKKNLFFSLSLFDLLSFVAPFFSRYPTCKSLPKCYIDGQKKPGGDARRYGKKNKNVSDAHVRRRLPLKQNVY